MSPLAPSSRTALRGSLHSRPVLGLALQSRQGSGALWSRCCQMLGCKRLRGAPQHSPEAGPQSSRVRMAPVRGGSWPRRGGLRGSLAASSPLKYPDFIDGCQGGRHVGLKVSVVHPGLAKSPRRWVVLPVVMPVPLTVCPEAIQVHLQGQSTGQIQRAG